jgi:hypothetical protein
MLLFSPVLELALTTSGKVYINGSTTFFHLGRFFCGHLAAKPFGFQV